MKKIMAVVSAEKKFAERFCDYINEDGHIIYTAVPFSDMGECRNYRKDHPVPVILADENMIRDELLTEDLSGIRTIPLCDDERISESRKSIYKYQSAEAIVREILDCAKDLKIVQDICFTGRPVSVIGIYSPASCEGKTEFALAMAAELRKRKRVLYMNFEEFSGLSDLMGESYDRGLSNALYWMKQDNLSGQRIASMVYTAAGFDYIPPIQFADDYSAVTGDECARLITQILSETFYDCIVADLPVSLSVSSDILELCESIYMPVLPGKESSGRIREFDEYLVLSDRRKIASKVKKIRLPVWEKREEDLTGTEYIDRLMFGPLGSICGKELAQYEYRC